MLLRLCMLMIGSVMAIGFFTEAEAQVVDVIYLKNGSVVRGIIVEQIPNETLRIRTQGGSEFVFKMSEVLKITKELPIQRESPMPVRAVPDVKNPTVSCLFSIFLVGAGQFYNEEPGKGILFFLMGMTGWGMFIVGSLDDADYGYDRDRNNGMAGFGLVLWGTLAIVSPIEAYYSAKAINKRNRQNQGISLIRERLLLAPYTSREASGAMLSLRF